MPKPSASSPAPATSLTRAERLAALSLAKFEQVESRHAFKQAKAELNRAELALCEADRHLDKMSARLDDAQEKIGAARLALKNPTAALDQQLCSAVAQGRLSAVRHLLAAGASIEARDHNGIPALFLAAVRPGRMSILKLLIKKGARDDPRCESYTALSVAVAAHNPGAVNVLLESSFDACVSDQDGHTPLHMALASGDENSARALIPYSDLSACTHDGRTVLDFAKQWVLDEAADDPEATRAQSILALLESMNISLGLSNPAPSAQKAPRL